MGKHCWEILSFEPLLHNGFSNAQWHIFWSQFYKKDSKNTCSNGSIARVNTYIGTQRTQFAEEQNPVKNGQRA